MADSQWPTQCFAQTAIEYHPDGFPVAVSIVVLSTGQKENGLESNRIWCGKLALKDNGLGGTTMELLEGAPPCL